MDRKFEKITITPWYSFAELWPGTATPWAVVRSPGNVVVRACVVEAEASCLANDLNSGKIVEELAADWCFRKQVLDK